MPHAHSRRSLNESGSLLEAWTRARFALGQDAEVDVSETASTLPGYPERETTVTFRTADGLHRFRIFKRMAEVTEDDMPPAWMKSALLADDTPRCSCC